MSTLIMFSMAECPTCERARMELRAEGTPFEERLVDGNPEHQQEVIRLTLQRTVPVFLKDGRAIVGFHGERG